MNCPACHTVMFIKIKLMECSTGNAQKFKCQQCGAEHWQQLSIGRDMNMRPLRESIFQQTEIKL